MKTLITNFLFCTILIFVNFKTINAQSYIGLTYGYNAGKYFESWKQKYTDFDSKYRIKGGYQVSLYYQKVNPKNKGRFELQYGSQKTHFEITINKGNNATYRNLNYTFQYFQMNFDYSFNLINKNNKSLDIFVGPSGSVNFNSLATGNGWDFVSQLAYTPNGQPFYTTTSKDWEISNEKGGGLSKFNFGINFGLDFNFPIYKNIDCIIQNRNTLFLNRQIYLSDINITAFIKSGLSVGLRYTIN
jgi:hypothetical protein